MIFNPTHYFICNSFSPSFSLHVATKFLFHKADAGTVTLVPTLNYRIIKNSLFPLSFSLSIYLSNSISLSISPYLFHSFPPDTPFPPPPPPPPLSLSLSLTHSHSLSTDRFEWLFIFFAALQILCGIAAIGFFIFSIVFSCTAYRVSSLLPFPLFI